jgi:predicted acyl esterase
MRTRHNDTTAAPVLAGLTHPRSVPTIESDIETAEESDQPFVEGAHDQIDPDLRRRMISEAAYHLYEARGYADGYDLDDWLQAETGVDHLLDGKSGAGG